jgi:hypothetical protein
VLAYVSYNTHPGWHLRDMMLFHARRFEQPAERVAQARAFLDFLAAAVNRPDPPFGSHLREEAELLRDAPDSYLFHEHPEATTSHVLLQPAGAICRPAQDPCDVAEVCGGGDAACSGDARTSDGELCDDGDRGTGASSTVRAPSPCSCA